MNLHYQITPSDPHSHLFDVSITVLTPNLNGQVMRLANWIPGSYLIRDFAKNLIGLRAQTVKTSRALSLQPLTTSSWQIEACDEAIEVHYQVYAWDLSVRSAHFDQTHAFFNGTSAFFAFDGLTEQPCSLRIHSTAFTQQQQWHLATGMTPLAIGEEGFGEYQADSYLDLIDYPVEMGRFHALNFNAKGIPHRIVFTGRVDWQTIDEARLLTDLTKICEYELDLFDAPYPIEQYLFMVMVTEKDYGGLEHLNSTALICARNDLPTRNMGDKPSEGYLQFLELCSHEYFHTWNVKRIQPEAYQQTDLQTPAYSEQLWWFEGITSYYDALILFRSGVIELSDYLQLLAEQMTRVYRMPGRFQQSVAESSFHTWTKFYQQDENAPNAIISYYTKGSLIALALDLIIRHQTSNQKSLDDILLHLWQHYGAPRHGLPEKRIEQLCSEISGIDLSDFFQQALYGTEDIDFKALFQPFGISFSLRAATQTNDKGGFKASTDAPLQLGANLVATPNQTVKLTHVWQGQTAHQAGLAAGDELIALAGLKISSPQTLDTLLNNYRAGDQLTCHYFRRDELYQTELSLQAPIADRVVLEKHTDFEAMEARWP